MIASRSSLHPDFDRRLKADHSIDSVCLHCLRNLGSSFAEAEVSQIEALHWCWQRQAKLERERARESNTTPKLKNK